MCDALAHEPPAFSPQLDVYFLFACIPLLFRLRSLVPSGFQEDRELIAKLRPVARFSSAEDHDELIDNLLLAKKMRWVCGVGMTSLAHVTSSLYSHGLARFASHISRESGLTAVVRHTSEQFS